MPYSGVVAIVLSCRSEEEKFYFILKRESAALLEEKNSESHSVMSYSLRPHGLYSPWISPDQNTGVGSRSLLQGIFTTQGSNSGLAHGRQILYQLSHQESWSRVIPLKIKRECVSVPAQSLSCVRLFATSWTAACQNPFSMESPRQEYWSGLPFPLPGNLPLE